MEELETDVALFEFHFGIYKTTLLKVGWVGANRLRIDLDFNDLVCSLITIEWVRLGGGGVIYGGLISGWDVSIWEGDGYGAFSKSGGVLVIWIWLRRELQGEEYDWEGWAS